MAGEWGNLSMRSQLICMGPDNLSVSGLEEGRAMLGHLDCFTLS